MVVRNHLLIIPADRLRRDRQANTGMMTRRIDPINNYGGIEQA